MSKSMHVAIDPEIKEKLKPFAKRRKKSMTAIINYALEKLFEKEEEDPVRLQALERVIDRKFSRPKMFDPWPFFICLHNAAKNHPSFSAKKEWGPVVYLSEVDKSNQEIFIEVQEELKRELNGKGA